MFSHPMPGDCIKLAASFHGQPIGALAFITGKLGEARDVYAVSFSHNAYRDNDTTSACGSPTYQIPVGSLFPSGETVIRSCWRWKDNGRKSGFPEVHIVEARVWILDPASLPFEYSDAPNKARLTADEMIALLLSQKDSAVA